MDSLPTVLTRAWPDIPTPSQTVAFPTVERSSADGWARLPAAAIQPNRVGRTGIVDLDGTCPAAVAFNVMRTKTLKACRANGWTVVGVTAPTAECGTTSMTLNLAFSLARQSDCRIAVLDLNLSAPGLVQALGMTPARSMADFLSGRAPPETAFVRHGDNLAIGGGCHPSPRSSEILQAPMAAVALESLKRLLSPDVILVDLPPMRCTDEAMAFLPRLDCALLVVRAGATALDDIDRCERELAQETNVLGLVLNHCETIEDGHAY